MSASILFGPAAPSDYPELEEMILALYAEDPSTEGMSLEKIRRTLAELARHPGKGTIFVFNLDACVMGYAILIHFWSNEYGGEIEWIDELYVKPAWRGRGVGSAFLEHLCRNADPAIKGLQLEVTPRNARARALYTRHGFRPAKNAHLFKKVDVGHQDL